ncbi:DUF4178 domain-containing protein [Corynebacterium lowii]|uniref:DUF4178 domain-containing protein n=1 Tax=Corynebacterium lowii TaxID=1544413 RepID=A0A0Q1AIX3_9CORY|nr:DUF4178 domain-containing protein [Corynebacterium lowii]KQB86685.1 hypothetical protein Clow_00893 [Corynebacterium lowii]MDP9851370.1 hypothetical protein [Corynebacterium lowii]
MNVWLIIIIALLILAVYFAYQGWKRSEKNQRSTVGERRDPFADTVAQDDRTFGPQNLGPGAIVARGGVDYVVRGTITVRQGYYVWHEHLLDGGKSSEWLSVEIDEGQLKISWWNTREDLSLQPDQQHTVADVDYVYQESGIAQFSSEGTTGLPESGSVEFYDYADASGSRLLGLERFGEGSWETSLGEAITPGEITVYPAPRS